MGMRLFMMLPPGKLNFTFIDPVTLGESFAMFTRLVDVDDRTSEVINGKIWSSPTDIEQKLKVMTDHISNVHRDVCKVSMIISMSIIVLLNKMQKHIRF